MVSCFSLLPLLPKVMKMDRDFTLKQTPINRYVISMVSFILGTDLGFQVRGARSIRKKKKKTPNKHPYNISKL